MLKAREIDEKHWQPVESAVLCFVRDKKNQRVLLIHKKTGLGKGLINAPGGRIEPGETPEEAAIRETQEEVGLQVKNLHFAGDLLFQFIDGHSIRGYVFTTEQWSGDAIETVEAKPFWQSENSIPYAKMWSDDAHWIPHMLADRPFRGRFVFDGETMLSMSLDVESRGKEGIPRPL
ncbi:MAG: 8-oxo-dGTP diphosphatase [Spirochaetales bacterium]|nr:8-oxo-dGTP diphosphatase [Spirochaetales bacterium]